MNMILNVRRKWSQRHSLTLRESKGDEILGDNTACISSKRTLLGIQSHWVPSLGLWFLLRSPESGQFGQKPRFHGEISRDLCGDWYKFIIQILLESMIVFVQCLCRQFCFRKW